MKIIDEEDIKSVQDVIDSFLKNKFEEFDYRIVVEKENILTKGTSVMIKCSYNYDRKPIVRKDIIISNIMLKKTIELGFLKQQLNDIYKDIMQMVMVGNANGS